MGFLREHIVVVEGGSERESRGENLFADMYEMSMVVWRCVSVIQQINISFRMKIQINGGGEKIAWRNKPSFLYPHCCVL